MKAILALAVAALLAGCGSKTDTTPVAGGQCMKDTDCKGDRICERGACVSPSATAVVPGAQPTDSLQNTSAVELHSAVAPIAPGTPVENAGAVPTWTTGFGQGNLEFFLRKDGVKIFIGCPTQDGSADAFSDIRLYRDDNSDQEISPFQLVAEGQSFDGPFEAMSRAGSANFRIAYDVMREGDFTIVYNGRSVQFPRTNGKTEIPDDGTCNVDW